METFFAAIAKKVFNVSLLRVFPGLIIFFTFRQTDGEKNYIKKKPFSVSLLGYCPGFMCGTPRQISRLFSAIFTFFLWEMAANKQFAMYNSGDCYAASLRSNDRGGASKRFSLRIGLWQFYL
ncbi:MAG: hypothetical protein Q8O09_05655 [Bacillota bacterium]|nr:hypothetical protein [Bacillota bacterium]